jgi:hypothetical protein
MSASDRPGLFRHLSEINFPSIQELNLPAAFGRLASAETKDVQQIAAAQLELLTGYYQVALTQSRRSFFWALIFAGAGLVFFIVAVVFPLPNGLVVSIAPLIAGAVVEVISGIGFYLYGKTSSQLSAFHHSLDILQRYLLANSICESLDSEARSVARSALIGETSRAPAVTP